eukprot:6609202-Pyramimonas_sp.AAC.1
MCCGNKQLVSSFEVVFETVQTNASLPARLCVDLRVQGPLVGFARLSHTSWLANNRMTLKTRAAPPVSRRARISRVRAFASGPREGRAWSVGLSGIVGSRGR